jgi:hypothetical protein
MTIVRSIRPSVVARACAAAIPLVAATLPGAVRAQVVERRGQDPAAGPATTWVGGALTYGQPQRDFANYVNAAFGLSGHLVHALDRDGIVAFRADAGFLVYGQTRNRQPLGGGALGLIMADVTTSNNIFFGTVGAQLMAPNGRLRPYANAAIGFSYFSTQSSVEGTGSSQPFANSENFSDGGFTTMWGGGLYLPLGHTDAGTPFALDLGVQSHANRDIQYLTKNSITIIDSSKPPVITPVRSPADFLAFRLGVTFGVR